MSVSMAKRALFEVRDEWLTRPIDNDHVEVLVGVLNDGGELPPLTVVRLESGALAVVDGNHRFAAYAAAKRDRIPYRIVADGEAAIEWWLAAANSAHGKNRSAAEKREAVARALRAPEGGDMDNVGIARWCGVSVDLVRSVRAEERGAPSAAAERRQVLDGKREQTGSSRVPRSTRNDRRRVSETQAAHVSDETASRPEPPVTDATELPFETPLPEWQVIAADCDAIANGVLALRRAHSHAFKRVPGGQEIVDLLERVHGIATRRKPHACPAPHGDGACPVCGDRGYTSGKVEGWEGIVAAAAARRAHA